MTDEKDELEMFFEGEEHDEISTEKPVDEPAKVETETEQEAETESETTSEEKSTSVPEGYAPIAALQDERRKAQQFREEAEALRAKLPQTEEAPDPYEDIDKYNEFMRQKWEREQFEIQEQKRIEDLDKSRSKMLEQHTDYDEMEKIFGIMTIDDKSLIDKMYASGDAAKFAYETAKEYKASLLSVPEIPETEAHKPVEVPNLAKATAVAQNTPQVEQEATIEDIFADQTY